MPILNLELPIDAIGPVDGWKSIPIAENGEPLVPLGAFGSYGRIATDSIYVGERRSSPYPCLSLRHALFAQFVRRGVAERLLAASRLLPACHMLLVWDAYRPLAVQRALFERYVSVLEGHGVPSDQAIVDAQRFVSIPSDDPTRPPPHATGGAVDLTVIRFFPEDWREMRRLAKAAENASDWRLAYEAEMRRQLLIRRASTPLDMGTVFDATLPETATRYYEDIGDSDLDDRSARVRANRRLLWNVMRAAGFSNYAEEWWHFDCGNQFAAARTGQPAVYGPATFSEENAVWESMRRGHHLGVVEMVERGAYAEGEIGTIVRAVAYRTGHPGHTTHPIAAAL